MQRNKVTLDQVDEGLRQLREEILRRLDQHGPGEFVSTHEILGVVTEEYHELVDAVKDNQAVDHELMDIAVGALFGAICLRIK
jgi:hypothetical protein